MSEDTVNLERGLRDDEYRARAKRHLNAGEGTRRGNAWSVAPVAGSTQFG